MIIPIMSDAFLEVIPCKELCLAMSYASPGVMPRQELCILESDALPISMFHLGVMLRYEFGLGSSYASPVGMPRQELRLALPRQSLCRPDDTPQLKNKPVAHTTQNHF